MNWKNLTDTATLESIKEQSSQRPIVIFKHSTRCSISSMVLKRLERSWNDQEMDGIDIYFLDLISYREISNLIATTFDVQHESPQVLVISAGKCAYHASHMEINYNTLKDQLTSDTATS